jgi:formylglycine-generating enzyme required for sulfatase activity
MLHLDDKEVPGNLLLHRHQLDVACAPAGVAGWLRNHPVRLLLTHHGPEWLSDTALELFRNQIAPRGRFALHLFGHHHSDRALQTPASGDSGTSCQAPSLFGMRRSSDGSLRRHGYVAGELSWSDETITLALRPRMAEQNNQQIWQIGPDRFHYAELDSNGVHTAVLKIKRGHLAGSSSQPSGSGEAANSTGPTGTLAVQVAPAIAGTRIEVLSARDQKRLAEHLVSSAEGPWTLSLPPGEVLVHATTPIGSRDGAVDLTTRRRATVAAGQTRHVLLQIPLSRRSEAPWAALLQIALWLASQLGSRWRLVLPAALAALFLPIGFWLLYQHLFVASPNLIYVEPMDYQTGLSASGLGPDSRAAKMLRALANLAHKSDVNQETLFEAALLNQPAEREIKPYSMDRKEVTVGAYKQYLDRVKDPRVHSALTPKDWDLQQRNPDHPVRSVTHGQADKYCVTIGGRLPSNDEWEAAARNLGLEGELNGKSLDPKEGTLYPWGDEFYPGYAQTYENGESKPTQVCNERLADRNKHSTRICDLGGNVREWIGDDAGRGRRWIRGSYYAENGEVGAMGTVKYLEVRTRPLVLPGTEPAPPATKTGQPARPASASPAADESEADFVSEVVGFRCVWDKGKVPTDAPLHEVAQMPGGKFWFGRPNHPIFDNLVKYGSVSEYLLTEERTFPKTGGFFVQAKKVSRAEYRQFVTAGHTDHDRESGEPDGYDHNVPAQDGDQSPVLGVSWYDAYAYCQSVGMRLPTEPEWERITRGNDRRIFPWGDSETPLKDVDNLKRFLKEGDDLLRSMWTDGMEWTLTDSKQQESERRHPPVEWRILKGILFPQKYDPSNYVTTMRFPAPVNDKFKLAGIRCIADGQKTLLERLFGTWLPSRRMTEHRAQ